MIDEWKMIGAGEATIRENGASAYAGKAGSIEAVFDGAFLIAFGNAAPIAFGSGEIGEIRLSKSDAAKLSKDERMPDFLKALSTWAEAHGTAGRTVESLPLEGPGTMRWVAR